MKRSGAERIGRLVLDTSAYSHLRIGNGRVIELLSGAELIFLPVTVLGELEGAFELSRRAKENRVALANFLEEPFVSVLPSTRDVARQYGRIYAALRQSGTPIPTNDIWIAAATIDCGGRLLTFDSDFARVRGLDSLILRR